MSRSVLLTPHSVRSPADDDLPASSSGSLASSDVNSLPTASTPRADKDAVVGSQRGTHQEEAPEAPSGSLPDFVPDSTSDGANDLLDEAGRSSSAGLQAECGIRRTLCDTKEKL